MKNVQSENLFQLQTAAFTSWTILVHGYGIKKSWKQFSKEHGISVPEEKMSDEDKSKLVREQIERANNIIRFDAKRTERINS